MGAAAGVHETESRSCLQKMSNREQMSAFQKNANLDEMYLRYARANPRCILANDAEQKDFLRFVKAECGGKGYHRTEVSNNLCTTCFSLALSAYLPTIISLLSYHDHGALTLSSFSLFLPCTSFTL